MTWKRLAFIAFALELCASAGWADEPTEAEVNRLKRVAAYLKHSANTLYDEKKVAAQNFSPTQKNLWDQAKSQHDEIFGTLITKARFDSKKASTKELEERMFDILEALWGEKWPSVIHPDP